MLWCPGYTRHFRTKHYCLNLFQLTPSVFFLLEYLQMSKLLVFTLNLQDKSVFAAQMVFSWCPNDLIQHTIPLKKQLSCMLDANQVNIVIQNTGLDFKMKIQIIMFRISNWLQVYGMMRCYQVVHNSDTKCSPIDKAVTIQSRMVQYLAYSKLTNYYKQDQWHCSSFVIPFPTMLPDFSHSRNVAHNSDTKYLPNNQ